MDIQQIKKEKLIIENKIRDLIMGFTEETGLIVENINYEMIDVSTFGSSSKQYQYTPVTLDVRLD